MRFRDRSEAGRRLAEDLSGVVTGDPVVVALPRGGVPVGIEVARGLGAPLDILGVRKLGAPGNPELAVGAVAEDGTAVFDPRTAGMLGMNQEMLDEAIARETRELARRVARYRGGRPPVELRGRTAIIVDDGMATGMTELAAVRAARRREADRIVVAVPVASGEAVEVLEREADRVITPAVPTRLYGVGMWYDDFAPVSDAEVLALLQHARLAAPERAEDPPQHEQELAFELDGTRHAATLVRCGRPRGLVIFAHGSGSSRRSPRNRTVSRALAAAQFAALLIDLLDAREADRRELSFDIELLCSRLIALTERARALPEVGRLPVGYFGASTGAAAALSAAALLGDATFATVSRGGRPDLAGELLAAVRSPTLLIVGSRDQEVLELNRAATARLRCEWELAVVEGAGHLFEEPGALEEVSKLAAGWFESQLA